MEDRLYILDGGLATEIERRGVSLLVMLTFKNKLLYLI